MTTDGAMGSIVAAQVADWFSSKGFASVALTQHSPSSSDPSDDYIVVHESHFRPLQIECAMVEIMVTADGYIGIGLERRSRIASRLNTKDWLSHGFAAGFEPCEKSNAYLIPFLELVSSGRICLFARNWPIVGLGRIYAAIVSDQQSPELGPFGPPNWLKRTEVVKPRSGLVTFRPWT